MDVLQNAEGAERLLMLGAITILLVGAVWALVAVSARTRRFASWLRSQVWMRQQRCPECGYRMWSPYRTWCTECRGFVCKPPKRAVARWSIGPAMYDRAA